MEESDSLLKPEIRQRFETLVNQKVITADLLASFMNSVEKRNGRKEKKKRKQDPFANNTEKIIKTKTLINFSQSFQVWGRELVCPENKLESLSSLASSAIFNDPDFHFCKVVLQGLSIAQMANYFPKHNWGRYKGNQKSANSGFYSVSYNNPLVNLRLNKENEMTNSKEVIHLDLCLTVELLITLSVLNNEIPSLFFRTSAVNSHEQNICVGLNEGKITFITENIARHNKRMGVCLVKYESWMDY